MKRILIAAALLLAAIGIFEVGRAQNGTPTFNGVYAPNGAPLAIANFAQTSGGTGWAPFVYSNPATPGFTVGNEAGQAGVGARNPGVEWFMSGQTLTASGNNGTMFNITDSFMSDYCWMKVESNAGTGTTPTLNFYLQDSAGDGLWDDRIAFTQITTSPSSQIAAVNFTAALNPVAPTDGTLAAGTVVAGPVAPYMRVKWVITGTTPSFGGVTAVVFCK